MKRTLELDPETPPATSSCAASGSHAAKGRRWRLRVVGFQITAISEGSKKMRSIVLVTVVFLIGLAAPRAEAASCSVFLEIKSYDVEAKTVEVKYTKGSQSRYFPKPEGSTTTTTKLPKKCSKRITKKNPTLPFKPTGGRMSVTQFRTNFSGKMLNNTDDPKWVTGEFDKLIASETTISAILRPSKRKNDPPQLTTIYLPITDEERAEIKRIEATAVDVD
ncbi:MAG: hypothetical protein GY772_30035 [bacterium]|jgi:hypothetical protein|nr:hypothetical protein [bacterium]HJO24608.1 hypothetical protein [Myxococcota bacterium]